MTDDVRPVGPSDPAGSFLDVRGAFAAHGRDLYGFAFNSVRDAALAEDCVQEVFIRAWRARDRYQAHRGSERTWLFAIARNVIIDELRARARRPVPGLDEHLDVGADRGGGTRAIEDRIVLYAGLAMLSTEHRAVIVAVQLEGLTYQQVQEKTGVPAATLRTRMYYGLKALRSALGEEAGP
ncbi:RNA polymerase sigma factor [Arthrobacter sp. MDT1-65]